MNNAATTNPPRAPGRAHPRDHLCRNQLGRGYNIRSPATECAHCHNLAKKVALLAASGINHDQLRRGLHLTGRDVHRALELAAHHHPLSELAREALAEWVQWMGGPLSCELTSKDVNRLRALDAVPNKMISQLIDARLPKDPDGRPLHSSKYKGQASTSWLAEQIGVNDRSLSRRLGQTPESNTRNKHRGRPQKYNHVIDVEQASLIVRVLGIAPIDMPGL